MVAQKLSYELKWRYLKAVLTQNEAWYEQINVEELPSRINFNISEIENAAGKELGIMVYGIGAALGGIGK